MIDSATSWATATGVPNWLFVVALLTHPKVWSDMAVSAVRDRLERRS